jgi:hypothetical protein
MKGKESRRKRHRRKTLKGRARHAALKLAQIAPRLEKNKERQQSFRDGTENFELLQPGF